MTRYHLVCLLVACSSSSAQPEPTPTPAVIEPARVQLATTESLAAKVALKDWVVAAIARGDELNVRAFGPGGKTLELRGPFANGTIRNDLWVDGDSVLFHSQHLANRVPRVQIGFEVLEIGWNPAQQQPTVQRAWSCDESKQKASCDWPLWGDPGERHGPPGPDVKPAVAMTVARSWFEALRSKSPESALAFMGPRIKVQALVYGTTAKSCKSISGRAWSAGTEPQRSAAARCIAEALGESGALRFEGTTVGKDVAPMEVAISGVFEDPESGEHARVILVVSPSHGASKITSVELDVSVKNH